MEDFYVVENKEFDKMSYTTSKRLILQLNETINHLRQDWVNLNNKITEASSKLDAIEKISKKVMEEKMKFQSDNYEKKKKNVLEVLDTDKLDSTEKNKKIYDSDILEKYKNLLKHKATAVKPTQYQCTFKKCGKIFYHPVKLKRHSYCHGERSVKIIIFC